MATQEKRWVCTICGYVHQGTELPDCCPICGSTPDLFELQAQAASPHVPVAADRWTCLNCDYIHHGFTPPATCPVCGLPAEQFGPGSFLPVSAVSDQEAISIVIVGAGIAGVSAAEIIRRDSPAACITLLSKDPDLPYFRLNLTRYLAGEIAHDDLFIHPEEWYRENGIDLRLNSELRSLDPDNRVLSLSRDETLAYDRLILAMGSHPFVPPIPGINRENVTVLRTLRDAEGILGQCRPGLPCVIIGGGVLGLETAGALARRGACVTLLEGFGWLMPQQLNQTAGDLLAGYVTDLGINIRTNVRINQIDGDDRVRGILLENGESIPAELVIVTAGVRSNTFLLRRENFEVNQGVVVSDTLQTSREQVYAVGDISEHRGVTYGTWAPAQFQGVIAGLNAIGKQVEFAGIPRSNTLKVLDCELFSIGQVHPHDGSFQTYDSLENRNYRCFIFRDGQLVGAMLLGEMRLVAAIKKLIENKVSCTDLLHTNPDIQGIISYIESLSRQ